MSYKSVILSDYPIGYYPLDDLTTVDVTDYTTLVDDYDTYQEILDDTLITSYASIYGDIAYDHSGCENDAIYGGDPITEITPIVIGNARATKIGDSNSIQYSFLNDYTATPTTSQFGTIYSSDNDFTLEAWFHPEFTTNGLTAIFADQSEAIGIFYDNENILFKAQSQFVQYTLPHTDKVTHIVGIYSPTLMSLYIDGQLVNTSSISNFKFSNTEIALKSGPTTDPEDSFLVNSVAVYRYSLSQSQIKNHYDQNIGLTPIQIVDPDNGELFELYDDNISTKFIYSYPGDKSWNYFITDDLYYNEAEQSLSIKKATGSKSVVITDYISLPYSAVLDSSKIEWEGTSGILVEASVDGTTYETCENGQTIPQFTLASFDDNKQIYLKITLSTPDSSKYLPKISTLQIKFYNNQIAYASNSASYISTLEGAAGVSIYDITIGNNKYPILSRNARNGIRTVQDSGFYINTTSSVYTLEFFYTPYALTDSGLVSTVSTGSYSASNYSWRNTGTISKTNISAIYVNDVDKTSETNISNVFKLAQIHHVVIVFTSPVSGQLKFDYSLYGSVPGLFQNIAIYPDEFTALKTTQHYHLYIYGSTSTVSDDNSPSITLTENYVNYYDNDWIVVQNS
jgi:hypothetical protein